MSFKNYYLGTNNNTLAASDRVFGKYGQIAIGNVNSDHFQTTIRALKQVSDTKILSNPQILVTNNEEAKILIGSTKPYVTTTTTANTSGSHRGYCGWARQVLQPCHFPESSNHGSTSFRRNWRKALQFPSWMTGKLSIWHARPN